MNVLHVVNLKMPRRKNYRNEHRVDVEQDMADLETKHGDSKALIP